MKHDNLIKVIFDFVMVILLIMIYSVSATGLLFHEIVGLIIFLLFSIHLFYNRKWISSVGKKLSDKTFNTRLKFMYIIDVLLFCMFILAGISGILISKELFKLGFVFIWRYIHASSAAFSVLLLGIHIGLHGKMIVSTIKKYIKIQKFIGRALSIIIIFSIFSLGVYGIIKLSNSRNGENDKSSIRGISILNLFKDTINVSGSMGTSHGNERLIRGENGGGPEHRRENESGRDEHGVSGFNLFWVIITSSGYLSGLLICAIIVYFTESLIKAGKKEKKEV